MPDDSPQTDPTIAAFQQENACREDMDAASFRCQIEDGGKNAVRLEIAHALTIGLWLDAVEKTKAAHITAADPLG